MVVDSDDDDKILLFDYQPNGLKEMIAPSI